MKTTRSEQLSPEARLALLPARGAGRRLAAAALLQQPLDWRALITIADRERSALPLWRLIRDAGYAGGGVEAQVLKRMAGIWEFRLHHLERLLFRAVERLQRAGIDVVLLKGAAAALSTYERFSERPMVDIDLLVEPARGREAWLLVRELGWTWDAERFPDEAYRSSHQHLPPLQDGFGSGLGLEIHTALWNRAHPFRFTEADVRAEAVTLERDGVSFKVPRAEHQLLHCCVHFTWSHRLTTHSWRAFSDVDVFVSAGMIDWNEFVRIAKSSGTGTCAYWTLRLAGTLADVVVPGGVLRQLKPTGPEFALKRLERHFVLDLLMATDGCPSSSLRRRLWTLAVQRGKGPSWIDIPRKPRPKRLSERISHHSRSLLTWRSYLARVV